MGRISQFELMAFDVNEIDYGIVTTNSLNEYLLEMISLVDLSKDYEISLLNFIEYQQHILTEI